MRLTVPSHLQFSETTKDATLWAFYEVATVTLLSLVPLIFIAYYQYVVQDNGYASAAENPGHQAFLEFAYANIAAGQLAFYAIANWAVVAWICGVDSKRAAPLGPILVGFCILGFTYCGVLIAITAAKNYVPSQAVTIPSAITYGVSIVCYFALIVLRQIQPPSAEATNLVGASKLHREVNKLRGEIDG